MKTITTVGLGLLVVGALVFVASSGAFDSASADRGVEVTTAADEGALLGLEYPSEDRTLELSSGQSDGGGWCFFGCVDYRYNDEELARLEDNTVSGDLYVEEITFDTSGDDIVGGDGLRHESTDDGFRALRGDFRCPARGGFGTGTQRERTATVTATIRVSDGRVTIDLERRVTVTCVGD